MSLEMVIWSRKSDERKNSLHRKKQKNEEDWMISWGFWAHRQVRTLYVFPIKVEILSISRYFHTTICSFTFENMRLHICEPVSTESICLFCSVSQNLMVLSAIPPTLAYNNSQGWYRLYGSHMVRKLQNRVFE